MADDAPVLGTGAKGDPTRPGLSQQEFDAEVEAEAAPTPPSSFLNPTPVDPPDDDG